MGITGIPWDSGNPIGMEANVVGFPWGGKICHGTLAGMENTCMVFPWKYSCI